MGKQKTGTKSNFRRLSTKYVLANTNYKQGYFIFTIAKPFSPAITENQSK